MSQNKISGRIKAVRVSMKGDKGNTTIIIATPKGERQIVLSAKQLESVSGITRPHSTIGARIDAELHSVGDKYGPNNALEQTQEYFDAGIGVKEFSIELAPMQEMVQGQLLEFRKMMAAQYGNSNAPTRQTAAAAEEQAAPAGPKPVTNPEELIGEGAEPVAEPKKEPALDVQEGQIPF
jgi:hypothetical protein